MASSGFPSFASGLLGRWADRYYTNQREGITALLIPRYSTSRTTIYHSYQIHTSIGGEKNKKIKKGRHFADPTSATGGLRSLPLQPERYVEKSIHFLPSPSPTPQPNRQGIFRNVLLPPQRSLKLSINQKRRAKAGPHGPVAWGASRSVT